jgi:hypothetical protein
VGGNFANIGGQARLFLAALDTSTGSATSWNPNANGDVYAFAVSGSTLYVGGFFNSIGGQTRNNIAALDMSTGNATSWNPNASSDVYAMALSGSTVYAGGLFTSIGGQTRNKIAALDIATGNATSWNPNADNVILAIAVSGSTVYAGGFFASIGGQTRNDIAALDRETGNATSWNPNANDFVLTLALDSAAGRVYAGGSISSVLKNIVGGLVGLTNPGDTSMHVTDVKTKNGRTPKVFGLLQNYPNPFNPSTTIRFSVPIRSRVRLTIFNLLGQPVAELVNEEMDAGNFERTWNGNVASGLYLYRVEAVSIRDPNSLFVDVKKMILLK